MVLLMPASFLVCKSQPRIDPSNHQRGIGRADLCEPHRKTPEKEKFLGHLDSAWHSNRFGVLQWPPMETSWFQKAEGDCDLWCQLQSSSVAKKDIIPAAGWNSSRMVTPDWYRPVLEAENVAGSSTTSLIEQDNTSNDSAWWGYKLKGAYLETKSPIGLNSHLSDQGRKVYGWNAKDFGWAGIYRCSYVWRLRNVSWKLVLGNAV